MRMTNWVLVYTWIKKVCPRVKRANWRRAARSWTEQDLKLLLLSTGSHLTCSNRSVWTEDCFSWSPRATSCFIPVTCGHYSWIPEAGEEKASGHLDITHRMNYWSVSASDNFLNPDNLQSKWLLFLGSKMFACKFSSQGPNVSWVKGGRIFLSLFPWKWAHIPPGVVAWFSCSSLASKAAVIVFCGPSCGGPFSTFSFHLHREWLETLSQEEWWEQWERERKCNLKQIQST